MGLFLTACGGGTGVSLDCNKSGWLSNPGLIKQLNRIFDTAKPGLFDLNTVRSGIVLTAGQGDEGNYQDPGQIPRVVEENLFKITMNQKNNVITFRPKKKALYRIYTSENVRFNIKEIDHHPLGATVKNVSAKRHISNCVAENKKPVQKIVEFSMVLGREYIIKFLNSDTNETYLFIYAEADAEANTEADAEADTEG